MDNYVLIINENVVCLLWDVKLCNNCDNTYIAFEDENQNTVFTMAVFSWGTILRQKESYESKPKIEVNITTL
jgi:hypothetical protein